MDWRSLYQVIGYPLVALGIGLESMGIPAPGETILLLAAAAAATGLGQISWVIAAAALGAIIGDNVAFQLGRRYGRSILTRIAHLSTEQIARSEVFFERQGAKTVIIARFIPVVRSVSAYLAGINLMPPRQFALYNVIGGVLWAVLIGSLGFLFGSNLTLLETVLRRVGGVFVAVLLTGLFFLWLNYRWRQSQRHYRSGRIGMALSWLQTHWLQAVENGTRWLLIYGLVVVVSSWAVGVLVDDWVEHEAELYQRDQVVTQWLQLGEETIPEWVEVIAFVGDVRLLAGVALLTAVWLWQQKRRRLALLSLVSFAGGLALGWGLQVWLKRPLPPDPESVWQLTTYAFPHLSSMMAVVVYGWLAYVWGRQRDWNSQVHAGTMAAFVSISIGIIGLYLAQAHLSDVLVALPLGLLWLGIPLAFISDEMTQYGRRLKAKTSVMPTRNRLLLLAALTVPVVILTFVQPPIAQDPSYHHFADTRSFWGIANLYNVVSNAAFLAAGLFGLRFLQRQRQTGQPPAFMTWEERRPYLIFFSAVAITCFGSAYYHLNPNDTHLVWDRLPMTFGFVSLFAAIIMERIDRDAGFRLLTPLVILGIISVLYWYWGDRAGRGDLRLYVDVQFYPLLAIPLLAALFPSQYTEGKQIFTVIFLYGLAKLLEVLDKPVFTLLNGHISGHTLKHVVAALATAWVVWMLSQREPVANRTSLKLFEGD